MVYESSYESGRLPFSPDTTRGYWQTPRDYVWACLGLTLKLDLFSMSWMFLFECGVGGLLPYMLCLFLYVVPIMVLQSFMGQFSSSGFISTFRIAPIFKGMGYICLVVNIVVLFYYTLLAALPLFFFLNSFRPTLPWSCAAMDEWSENRSTYEQYNICNFNATIADDGNYSMIYMYHLPAALFMQDRFNGFLMTEDDPEKPSISFELMMCILFSWSLIAVVFHYCPTIQRFGIFLRYAFWTVLGALLMCLVRFSFLSDAHEAIVDYFTFHDMSNLQICLPSIPLFVINSFGGGWGVIVTLSSFNNFKTDIMSYNWIICIGQMFIMTAFSMVITLTEAHFRGMTDGIYYHYMQSMWTLFLSGASALADIPLANFWCLLFFGMLTLSAIIVMSTQLMVVLTSLFDEFNALRMHKFEVTFGLIGIMAVLSLYFCTNFGIMHFSALSADALFTQTALNLFLLFVVLWVYGRTRFQRDIEFMVSKPFGSWRVFMLRFIAPCCLIFVLICALFLASWEHLFGNFYFVITTLIHTLLPWLILPGYAIYLLLQSSGPILMRLKRACRPNDWYPVDVEQRQKYEEAMNNMDITHQLTEVIDNNNIEVF